MSTETSIAPVTTTVAEAPKPQPKPPIAIGHKGVQLTTMDDMWRFAQAVSVSGFAPKGLEKQESVFIALQMGLELGLSPMAALQNIAVINGRPGIYGDAALACVRASGLLDKYEEWYEVDGQILKTGSGHFRNPTTDEVRNPSCTAYVLTQRKGSDEIKVEGFSVGDAKLASLLGKSGPWTQYPARMLKFRARGFNLRDNFGDVLKGFRTQEELADESVAPKTGFDHARPVFSPAKEPALPVPDAAPVVTEATPTSGQAQEAPAPTLEEVLGEPGKQPTDKEKLVQRIRQHLADENLPEAEFAQYLVSKDFLNKGKTIDALSLPLLNRFVDKIGDIAAEIQGAKAAA